jgi:hypothetical protein
MKRFMLASTALSAVIALAAAAPAFAGGSQPGGDDSAVITQVRESGGLATQHQPGLAGNTATITQEFGSGDVATQEQWRDNNSVDFAVTSTQVIFQDGNNGAGGTQVITQVGPAFNNQAGQSQGNSFNVATITQSGGANNVAIQNQGILGGASGSMVLSGGVVSRVP